MPISQFVRGCILGKLGWRLMLGRLFTVDMLHCTTIQQHGWLSYWAFTFLGWYNHVSTSYDMYIISLIARSVTCIWWFGKTGTLRVSCFGWCRVYDGWPLSRGSLLFRNSHTEQWCSNDGIIRHSKLNIGKRNSIYGDQCKSIIPVGMILLANQQCRNETCMACRTTQSEASISGNVAIKCA